MGADKVHLLAGFSSDRATNSSKKRMKKEGSKSGNSLKEKKAKFNPAYIWGFKKEHLYARINIRSKSIKVQLGSMRIAVLLNKYSSSIF
jgi:hypothetical protein